MVMLDPDNVVASFATSYEIEELAAPKKKQTRLFPCLGIQQGRSRRRQKQLFASSPCESSDSDSEEGLLLRNVIDPALLKFRDTNKLQGSWVPQGPSLVLLDTYGVYDAPEDGETPVPTKPADLAASYKQYYVPEESDDGTSEEEDAEVQAVADEMQPRESKTNAFELLRRQTAACLARGCGEESSQGTLPEGGTESEDESGISNAPRECLRECGNFGDMMTGIGQLFAPPGKKGAAEKDKQEREEQEQVGEGQWKMRRKSARFAAHNLAADNIIGRPDMRRMDSRMTIAEVEALAQQEVASDESDEDPTVILSRMKRKKKRTRKLGKFGKWFGGGFDPAWNPALQDVEKSWLQTLTAKEFRKEVSTARPVRLEVVPSHAQVWAVEEHAPADTGLAMEHSATVFRKVSRSDLMDPSSDRMERNDMAAEPEKRVGRGFKSLAFREK